jgi:hypothetical protein
MRLAYTRNPRQPLGLRALLARVELVRIDGKHASMGSYDKEISWTLQMQIRDA